MSNFASSFWRWINRFNSEGRDCGNLPVRRTEIGPSNRVNMGRLWPLSNENDKPKSPARYLCLTLSPCGREIQGKGLLQNHYIRTNFAALLHHCLMMAYMRQEPLKKPGRLASYRFIPSSHCPYRSHISTSTVKCNTFPNMRVRGKDIFGELDQIVAHFR